MKKLNQEIIEKLSFKINWQGKKELSGVYKLSKQEKETLKGNEEKYLKQVVKAFEKRQKETEKQTLTKNAKEWKLSVKKYVELFQKAKTILRNFHTKHSMGCYRTITIKNKNFATNHDINTYAKSCKYSPTYGSINIELSMKQLKQIEFIEGVPTIRLKNRKCLVLVGVGSKSNYFVTLQECFLIGSSHGETAEIALALEKEKRHQVAIKQLKENAFIGVKDIRKLGACELGIDSFCNRNNLNKEFGYRLDFLMELNDSQDYFKKLIKTN
jgi:hypothetical protein